ncbi:hypothetical protein JYT15_00320 [Acidimicrobium ferrooxidans]|nr:hypothetical protein [Acidimicrobium ferrooxidans]
MNSFSFKKHLASAAALIVLIILGLGSVDSEETTEREVQKATETAASNTTPTAELSASDLFTAYKDNEVAADEMYKDKVLIVTGTVGSIGKDITDTMYVTLESGEMMFSIQCFFSAKHKSKLAKIKKGDSVRILGKCTGKFGNVIVKGCTFAK